MSRGTLWHLKKVDNVPTGEPKPIIGSNILIGNISGEMDQIGRMLNYIDRESMALDPDELANDYAPREFEWCEPLDDEARQEGYMKLMRKLTDVQAEFVANGNEQMIYFRLSGEKKNSLVYSRFTKFQKLVRELCVTDFTSGNNKLLDVEDLLSDVYGDAIVMDGERFLSSTDGLRAIEPFEWYVASPEILMH